MRESASHSSRVRHDPRFTGPSEKPLCEYRVAPGMAMTVGMTMVLPLSHSFTQWGRLCQNDSWGETPVRRCSTPPLDDFPLQAGASGTSRLARARFGKSNDRISDPFRQALGITEGNVEHKNLPFISPPEPAHAVCGWGASYDITSRDFVCHKSPPHSRNWLTLWGRGPQSPVKGEVTLWGKIFASPSA